MNGLTAAFILIGAFLASAQAPAAGDLPQRVFVVPNFHPACCGWLTDWSTERNYCANSYLDHLDRVRADANYRFVISEVPNMIAILNFHPGRVEELKRAIADGRVEAVNAMFLEPTINLSGLEALVKCGVEGLRWQQAALGARARFAWMIDVTGTHEQMAQITAGLGLDALVYCRMNRTGSALHWMQSPDGTRIPAISPGHYNEWREIFKTEKPLDDTAVQKLLDDLRWRANRTKLTPEEIAARLAKNPGAPSRVPPGAPALVLAGSGDYSLAPAYAGYPTELLAQFRAAAPGMELSFSTLSAYFDSVQPGLKDGSLRVPLLRGGTAYTYGAFWIQNPRVKGWYRRCEHALQAAEMLATASSLRGRSDYPAERLRNAWLQMLLNMDRNTLWGAAGGMVFEDAQSWDARDRFEWVERSSRETSERALHGFCPPGGGLAAFNPANWKRRDPIVLPMPAGRSLKGVVCQAMPGDAGVLCQLPLPSCGLATFSWVAEPPAASQSILRAETIETDHYTARLDGATGALVSLKLKPDGRELLGGPANVVVAEKPLKQQGIPGDHIVERAERQRICDTSGVTNSLHAFTGPVAFIVEAEAKLPGGWRCRRVMTFHRHHPRIDFRTELENIPDRHVVVAEFPLAGPVNEVRRGIPGGFSHGAGSAANPALDGWTKGITPAVRWSDYDLGGAGVALLDRGLSGRELTGNTPVIFLYNAVKDYHGYPNAWLDGAGRHVLEYSLVGRRGGWTAASIPRLAWEFNAAPTVVDASSAAPPPPFVETSANLILEALRREGTEIEMRLVECLGSTAQAEVDLHLPHRSAALTDLTGGRRQPLQPQGDNTRGDTRRYVFSVRPQQIVTLRFDTTDAVSEPPPLTDWTPLVPEAKRAALHRAIERKGHPPFADKPIPFTPLRLPAAAP